MKYLFILLLLVSQISIAQVNLGKIQYDYKYSANLVDLPKLYLDVLCNNYTHKYTVGLKETQNGSYLKIVARSIIDSYKIYLIDFVYPNNCNNCEIIFDSRQEAQIIIDSLTFYYRKQRLEDSIERISHIYKVCEQ